MSARINTPRRSTRWASVKRRGNRSSRRRCHDGCAKPKLKGFLRNRLFALAKFARAQISTLTSFLPVLYQFHTVHEIQLDPFFPLRACSALFTISSSFFARLISYSPFASSSLCFLLHLERSSCPRIDKNAAPGRREWMSVPCDREDVWPFLDREQCYQRPGIQSDHVSWNILSWMGCIT